jgi:pimeloyl-ACP methyl ester carboxylesterase
VEAARQQTVTLDTGVRLSYVEGGAPDGRPVIFLHGVTDSWRSFEGVLPRLPPSIRAFAISQRGHGDSSRPVAGYRFADFAADVRAFIDAMGLGPVALVGHSMGSGVAMQVAIDHPRLVSRLVLAAAFAGFDDPEFVEFCRTSIAPLTDPIDEAYAREWQLSTLARPMDADHLDAIVAETLKVPARVWHETFAAFVNTPPFPQALRGFGAPALLVWGDRDAYVPREHQDRLLAALPAGRLVVHEGAGHAIHWEDPDRFIADLTAFLDA